MKLVRLDDRTYVNPDDVSSVTIPQNVDHVVVTMKTGDVHCVQPEYLGSCWSTADRIIKAAEGAS